MKPDFGQRAETIAVTVGFALAEKEWTLTLSETDWRIVEKCLHAAYLHSLIIDAEKRTT